jgi:hypothetical protein
MKRLSLLVFAFAATAVACTNEEDLGGRSGDGGAAAPSNEPSSTQDAGDASLPTLQDSGGKDSSTPNPFGATPAGDSCSPADFPPAQASCSIAGQYVVTETWCKDGTCSTDPPAGSDNYQWVANVTVSGSQVKLTDGSSRLLLCQLSTACDCYSESGLLTRFSGTGFVAIGKSDCPNTPGVTLYYRYVGVNL